MESAERARAVRGAATMYRSMDRQARLSLGSLSLGDEVQADRDEVDLSR
jgi:hypothetical protein